MGIFLFIVGFLGGLLFIIKLIIDIIKRNPKKVDLIGAGVCSILFIGGALLTPTEPNEKIIDNNKTVEEPKQIEQVKEKEIKEKEQEEKQLPKKTEAPKEVKKPKKEKTENIKVKKQHKKQPKKVKIKEDLKLELDEIQELYLSINDEDTRDDIVKKIVDIGLVHNEHEYSTGPTIKVARTEGQARHKYSDSGDYVEVSFNKDLEVEHVEYFNNDKFLSLIDYRQGTYWSLRDQPEYKGYYIIKPAGKLGSFIVKYDNGNEKDTGYLNVDSKEEQLKYLNKYKR